MKNTAHAPLTAAGPALAGFTPVPDPAAGVPVASGRAGHGLVAARPAVVGTAYASLGDGKFPREGGD